MNFVLKIHNHTNILFYLGTMNIGDCVLTDSGACGFIRQIESGEEEHLIVETSEGYKTIYIDDDPVILITPTLPKNILESARLFLTRLTFRKQNRLLTKISDYDQEEFYYGFAYIKSMLHTDFRLPSHLYYQAGDYSTLKLEEGSFGFNESFNHKDPRTQNSLMCGLAITNEKGARFINWFYASRQFYNLYLLIMYGPTYYIFKGMDKNAIMKSLECDELKNLYKIYAQVIVYGEQVPAEWGYDGLDKKIIENLGWMFPLMTITSSEKVMLDDK